MKKIMHRPSAVAIAIGALCAGLTALASQAVPCAAQVILDVGGGSTGGTVLARDFAERLKDEGKIALLGVVETGSADESYRSFLQTAAGKSVDIVAVGSLARIKALLGNDELKGLVVDKVRTLRVLGDVSSVESNLADWPTDVIITPTEVGSQYWYHYRWIVRDYAPGTSVRTAYDADPAIAEDSVGEAVPVLGLVNGLAVLSLSEPEGRFRRHRSRHYDAAVSMKNIREWVRRGVPFPCEYERIGPVADGLREVEYTEYDEMADAISREELARDWSNEVQRCAGAYNAGIFGRNFDWYAEGSEEYVVWFKGDAFGRQASVGVAFLWNDPEEKGALWLPAQVQDGINASGVAVSINGLDGYSCFDAAETQPVGPTVGTRPGAPRQSIATLPRFILDRATNAAHAVELIQKVDLFAAPGMENHLMICDATESYVVETVSNRLVILRGERAMTNFWVCESPAYGRPDYTTRVFGKERYSILTNGLSEITTPEGMMAQLRKINASGSYSDETNKLSGDTWMTLHASVYDIPNRTLYLKERERETVFTFKADGSGRGNRTQLFVTGDNVGLATSSEVAGSEWTFDGTTLTLRGTNGVELVGLEGSGILLDDPHEAAWPTVADDGEVCGALIKSGFAIATATAVPDRESYSNLVAWSARHGLTKAAHAGSSTALLSPALGAEGLLDAAAASNGFVRITSFAPDGTLFVSLGGYDCRMARMGLLSAAVGVQGAEDPCGPFREGAVKITGRSADTNGVRFSVSPAKELGRSGFFYNVLVR